MKNGRDNKPKTHVWAHAMSKESKDRAEASHEQLLATSEQAQIVDPLLRGSADRQIVLFAWHVIIFQWEVCHCEFSCFVHIIAGDGERRWLGTPR